MLLRDLKEIKDGRIIMKGSFIKDSRIILKDGEPNYYDMVVAVSRSSNNVKGNKEYAQRIIESKMKSSGVLFDQTKFDQAYSDFRKAPASRAAFYKHPEDSKSVKDQIAELECQKEQAKKQGYGTDAYDAAIAELQKDDAFEEEYKGVKIYSEPSYAGDRRYYFKGSAGDNIYHTSLKALKDQIDRQGSSKDSKTKDDEEAEEAFDLIHYNGYNIKLVKETGEFDIYDLGGAIIGHTATLELAKIFIDNKGRSIIGRTE